MLYSAHRAFTPVCYKTRMTDTKPVSVALLAALAFAGAAPAHAEEPTRGEVKLAEMLEGRVAGEPAECLSESQRDSIQIVDGTAIVFRDGGTLWVNRPAGAQFLSPGDLPVFHQFSSQLCRLDQVELRARLGSGTMPGPRLALGDFVPYTKADDQKAAEGG